ncbi:TonB-dependent receptor [candidate division KSB1 bacterium]|nr:TonB-dependent receptor [candidate division KSB1 bacterium]
MFLSLLSATLTVFAQEAQRSQPDSSRAPQYELQSVLVTATREARPKVRVPYAISVLGHNDIQRGEAALSLEEALAAIPGVVVNNRYNLAQGDRISMRGLGSRSAFGVRGLKIMLDGIPLTMPDGQSQLNNLDLNSIGRIEILRGPSSALYGNAAAGLINLQTQAAADAPLRVQPQFLTGSNGLRKWQTKLSGAIGKHNYFVNVSKLDLDDLREHSAARFASINAIGRHEISPQLKLTTVFNYYDSPYLLNPSSLSQTELANSTTATRFFIKQQAAGKKLWQGQAGATLKYGEAFAVTLYGLSRELLNPIPGRIIELDRSSGGVRSVFGKRFGLGNFGVRWLLGADYEMQSDARREFVNNGIPREQVGIVEASKMLALLQYGPKLIDQKEKVFGLGPFTEIELAFRSNWIATFGARYDRYKFEATDRLLEDGVDASGARTMAQFSPMLGLTFRPSNALAIYANYATAFQTPTTTELSNQPTAEGGFNPDLQPETLRSFELGVKGLWPEKHFEWDVALYAMNLEHMLIPYQIQNASSDEIFFRNAGAARNRGVELSCEWRPASQLRAALAYTFMNFEFTDFVIETANARTQLAGNKVPGVPPQHLFASLLYEHTSGVYAELEAQWNAEYFTNDFNGPPPGSNVTRSNFSNAGYRTVDLRLGLSRSFKKIGFDFFLGVNNLFDERYNGSIVPNAQANRFFEPAPERNWYVGGSVTLP